MHPWKGETIPEVTEWEEDKKYTWVKAPRYQGKPMVAAEVFFGVSRKKCC